MSEDAATEYLHRTVTTNAALLENLLRCFIGDPFDLLTPRPAGRGYWEGASDRGITMVDEKGCVVAFIAWSDLREIVKSVDGARTHTLRREGARHRDRIQRPD